MQIPPPNISTMFALTPEEQRWNLEEFRRKSNILLTNQERDYLHDILKQYQTYRDVQRLMVGLCNALDTPRKLDLLREIRNLIPLSHQTLFDRIAPYSRMMHPYNPVAVIMDSKPPEGRRKTVADPGRGVHNDKYEGHRRSTEEPGSTKMVVIARDYGGELGFGIKGCPGRRPGVIISHVVSGSQAEINGLKAGVQILEVNSIDFEKITVASALLVLQGSDRIRMKIMYAKPVSHRDKVPASADTTTTWIDTVQRKKVSAEYKDQMTRIDGTLPLTGGDERRVVLQLNDHHKYIGFNIRGGSEYGLGIYVSRVDKGGLAEANGIKVGDQITNVNGNNFEQITHAQAVEHIKNQRHLIVTIRSVNRYPAYKKEKTGDEGKELWEPRNEQREIKRREKPSSSARPASVHLPITEVKLTSNHFPESRPSKSFAESKPSNHFVESKPSKPYAESKPSNHFAESKPSRPFTESKPSNHFAESKPSKPFAESKPSNHYTESKPSNHFVASKPSKTFAESKPSNHFVESKPSKPFAESKPSNPFAESKPKQPTAEIKPLPPQIQESKHSITALNNHNPPSTTVHFKTSKPPSTLTAHFNTSQPAITTTTPQPQNGTGYELIEKLEQSIQTEPNMIPDRGGRKSLSPIPEVIRPSSQMSIATQTFEVPSTAQVPTTADRISPVTDRPTSTNMPVKTVMGPTMPVKTVMDPTMPIKTVKDPAMPIKTAMGTTALISPSRKLGRSMSMKVPGEKPMPMFDDDGDEQPRKNKKVQRNRTFREILFGIKVKHKDKEDSIGKEKQRERRERKARKKDSVAGANRKHSGVLAALKKNKSKDMIEDDRISKADSTYSGASSGEGSSVAGSSIQGSVGKQRGVFIQGTGTQIMHSNTADVSGMAMLTDRAKKLLNEDEVTAINRHVKRYHQAGDVEGLVEPLLAILDGPEKIQLLREVRGVILATDVGRFDSMVSRREIEAQEQLQAGLQENKKPPRDYLARSPSQRRKAPLDPKPDQHGNFYLQDQNDTDSEQHLQDELDSLKRWVEKEEQQEKNNAKNGGSPDRGHTVSGRPKERRQGLSSLNVPSGNSIVRRHSDNAPGRDAMQRNLKLNGLESTATVKSTAVKPTSPPPPPPQLLPKPVIKGPPRTPPTSLFLPGSPVKPASPHRVMPSPTSPCPTACIGRVSLSRKKEMPLPLDKHASPLRVTSPQPSFHLSPTKAAPPPLVISASPTPATPPPPSMSSRPTSPPSHYSTSTPLPTCILPPPPPNSTFSPSLSPTKSPDYLFDDLPPPPPPDPIPPLADISPLPPPPLLESLSPPPPPMATHPYNIYLSNSSPPPPPPVSPPPPPPLSPESFLVAQRINDTTRDENVSNSDDHIYSEINFNNMDVENMNKPHNTDADNINIAHDSTRKSLTFNVPPVQDAQFPNICVSEAEDDDEAEDSGDDVELPHLSGDSDDSDSSEEDSDNDDKRTYIYNLIEEEDEEDYDSSFDTPSPSPVNDRSISAPPALNAQSSSSALPALQTQSPSPAPPSLNTQSPSPALSAIDTTSPSPSPDVNGNSDKEEPIYATVDKKTRKTSRQDTLTVQFGEAEMEKEKEEEGESLLRRPSRVSFGEYQGSPLPPRRGILKNSFNRQEGGPVVQIRRSVPDYISISSDEDEPSPLKEITTYAKRRAQEDLLRPADDRTPSSSPKQGRKAITVQLSKCRASLGMSIAGGRESQGHPMVKIDKVYPGGAAADNGYIKPGYEVLEVDGTPLTSATHPEAVDIIRRSYNDKSKARIEFVVIPYE